MTRSTRFALPLLLAALVLQTQAGCQSCNDDEAISGKAKADANVGGDGGQLADGGALDPDAGGDGSGGGSAVGDDGAGNGDTADTADTADTTASDDAGSDTVAGPVPCTHDETCAATEICGLFYNGAAANAVEPAPGWAPICTAPASGGAQAGQACDPFSGDADTSLPVCGNLSACMQGVCTALCTADAHCPTSTRCGVTQAPVETDDGKGGKVTLKLPVDICLPAGAADADACSKTADCSNSELCLPWTLRKDGVITSEARCAPDSKASLKAAAGDACGVAASATGVGKLCKTAMCLYGSAQTAGVCTTTCDGAAACPATLTWNGTTFPTACAALLVHGGATTAVEDDVYWPHCVAVNEKSSVGDCAETRSCAGTEACKPFAIAWGPDSAAKVEYRCVEQATKAFPTGPDKDDGASCDPSALETGCKGGLCRAVAGGGVCTRVCKDDAGCASGTTCQIETLIPRADASKAATYQVCK